MLTERFCQICGAKFFVPHWREHSAKYCSPNCRQVGLRAKDNVVCAHCGKPFHLKDSHLKNGGQRMGHFCSRTCLNEYRKVWFRGENNHQFGLKGELNSSYKGAELPSKNNNVVDIFVYEPERVDANKRGRVSKHRLIVEHNWERFNPDAFIAVNGQHILKRGYSVHHIDGDHNNNDLSNLAVLTRGEHTRLHNQQKHIVRDMKTGRIIKIVSTDRGEGGYGSTGR